MTEHTKGSSHPTSRRRFRFSHERYILIKVTSRQECEISRELVAACVIECARDLLKVESLLEPLDLDIDLITGGDRLFGGYVMDSLGFVQWMAELEAQLEVAIMETTADTDAVRTLGELAGMILREASGEQLSSFCHRWKPTPLL